jgi:hypothetical protein
MIQKHSFTICFWEILFDFMFWNDVKLSFLLSKEMFKQISILNVSDLTFYQYFNNKALL